MLICSVILLRSLLPSGFGFPKGKIKDGSELKPSSGSNHWSVYKSFPDKNNEPLSYHLLKRSWIESNKIIANTVRATEGQCEDMKDILGQRAH